MKNCKILNIKLNYKEINDIIFCLKLKRPYIKEFGVTNYKGTSVKLNLNIAGKHGVDIFLPNGNKGYIHLNNPFSLLNYPNSEYYHKKEVKYILKLDFYKANLKDELKGFLYIQALIMGLNANCKNNFIPDKNTSYNFNNLKLFSNRIGIFDINNEFEFMTACVVYLYMNSINNQIETYERVKNQSIKYFKDKLAYYGYNDEFIDLNSITDLMSDKFKANEKILNATLFSLYKESLYDETLLEIKELYIKYLDYYFLNIVK